MNYTVQQAKDELIGMAHSFNNLNKVANVDQLLRRAYINTLSQITPQGAIRSVELPNLVSGGRNIVVLPDDVHSMIGIRPSYTLPIDLDLSLNHREASAASSVPFRKFIQSGKHCADIYNNRTTTTALVSGDVDATQWDVLSDIGGLLSGTTLAVRSIKLDNSWSFTGYDSVRVAGTLPIAGTGFFKILKTEVDKTMPSGRTVLNIPVRITDKNKLSTDASNFTVTITTTDSVFDREVSLTRFDGLSMTNGVNLLVADLGFSPNEYTIESIALKFGITVSSDLEFIVHVDDIHASTGSTFMAEYITTSIFETSETGVLNSVPQDDSDIVRLDESAYNIWLLNALKQIAQQTEGAGVDKDYAFVKSELFGEYGRIGLVDVYKTSNPSPVKNPGSRWYRVTK